MPIVLQYRFTWKSGTILFILALDMDITDCSGYKDFVWAVEIHRLGLEIVGLWPKNDIFATKSLRSELRAGIILNLLIFVSNIPMIYAIIQVWDDMVLVINMLRFTLPLLAISVRYIILRWKRTVFLSIVNMMAEDWMAFKSDAERTVMIKRAQVARLIMIIAYVFSTILFLTVVVPSYFGIQVLPVMNITDRSKSLPFETYHFYDTDKSPQYELTFFIHIITLFLQAIIYLSDIFLILIILHICGQLDNFRDRLISLVSCKNFNKALNNILVTHLRLIRFAHNIENMYSLIMLVVILNFAIAFGFNGFILTILLTERKINNTVVTQLCYTIGFFLIFLTSTFLYCGAGDLVMERCNAVHRSICDLEWYKLEPRKARNLILLMIRTNHPFRITAGKIIPLTMATFSSVRLLRTFMF